MVNSISTETLLMVLGIIVLLLLSGYASGAEVAFFSLSPSQIKELKSGRKKSSKRVVQLLSQPRYLLSTILIANNFINISIVISSYLVISEMFNFKDYPIVGFLFEVVFVTFIIVLFGEIIPKVFATKYNLKMARATSSSLLVLKDIFYPFSFILVKSTSVIERKLHKHTFQQVSMDEIDDAIEMTVDGDSSDQDVGILKGIVRFGNTTAKQVMRARVDIVAVDIEKSFKELLDIISESGYSRIPVYENDLDKVKGIVYAKDLLEHLGQKSDFEWTTLIREPFFVPENKKLDDLLKDFQTKRVHMAVVVDEYGGTSGIVTLEDILEEVIGEIKDEYDDLVEIDFTKVDESNYVFEAKTLLNDICKVMDLKAEVFDEIKGDADSLGGLILEVAKKIPKIREEVRHENFLFTILSVDKKRIRKVKITLLSDEEVEKYAEKEINAG